MMPMSCQIDIDFVPRVPPVPPVPPFLDTPYIQNTHTIEAIIYIFLPRMGVENNREQGEQRERLSKKALYFNGLRHSLFSNRSGNDREQIIMELQYGKEIIS